MSSRHPFQFPGVGFPVLDHDSVERLRNRRFLLVREWLSEAQHKPEPVGQNDVMKKFSEFFVLSSDFMLTNRPQQGGVRVPLVLDEVLQHGQHDRYFIKRATGEKPASRSLVVATGGVFRGIELRRVYVWWNKMRKPRLVAVFRIRSTD
jgi:hypothetical protein